MDDFIVTLLYYTVKMATPLLICCIGGVFVQKAGTLNFALEAGINTGAFAAIVFLILTKNLVAAVICSFLSCILLNLIFGLFVIRLKANATIVGLALNMFMGAIPPFILSVFFTSRGYVSALEYIDVSIMNINIPFLAQIPFLGQILNRQTFLTYFAYLLIIAGTFVFYKTRFGIHIQVTGENRDAAEAVGIRTNRLKWIALIISACTCALAGMNLSLEQTGMFSLNIASGRGLICLAAINCGKRRPVQSCLFALLFGFSRALQIVLSEFMDSRTTELINIIPYITIIFVFLITEIPVARRNTMRIFREG